MTGYILIATKKIDLPVSDIAILTFLFTIISIISLFIFFRGQTRDPESQTQHTLFSVGIKLLLEMILALVWFTVIKKTSLLSVFIFFVIYLTLTLILVGIILNTLKHRSLPNKY